MAAIAVAIRIAAVRAGVLAVSLAGSACRPPRSPTSPSRNSDSAPAPIIPRLYAGQKVSVRGVVSAPAFHFQEYTMLAIQDGHNGGVLKVPMTDTSLDRYRPGDEMEAEGTVGVQYGMTVLEPEKITVFGPQTAPAAEGPFRRRIAGPDAPGGTGAHAEPGGDALPQCRRLRRVRVRPQGKLPDLHPAGSGQGVRQFRVNPARRYGAGHGNCAAVLSRRRPSIPDSNC